MVPGFDYESLSDAEKIALVVLLAVAAHLLVAAIRRVSRHLMAVRVRGSLLKARTVISLASSILVFTVYFGALGVVLSELGVPIGTYLASASIIGLASAASLSPRARRPRVVAPSSPRRRPVVALSSFRRRFPPPPPAQAFETKQFTLAAIF